jgi:hypothetical protein
MRFFYESKEYEGGSAVDILRAMEKDLGLCADQRFSVKAFVGRSLAGMADRIHQRELDAGDHLSEETLAMNYLCLLDEYGIGRLEILTPVDEARSARD